MIEINFFFIFMNNNVKYTLIACVNKLSYIGNQGKLLYHIKNDMANFKRLTTNEIVIMGRKTFESLPFVDGLPNRLNIVLTSNAESLNSLNFENVMAFKTIEEVNVYLEENSTNKECFVIGGSQIYQKFIDENLIDKAIITYVDDEMKGDTKLHDFEDDKSFKKVFETPAFECKNSDESLFIVYRVYKKQTC